MRNKSVKSVCPVKGKLSAIYVNRIASNKEDTVAISITSKEGPATQVLTLPDTGSTLDAIPPSIFRSHFGDVRLNAGTHAENTTGNHIQSLGSFKASINWTANDGSSRCIESTVHVLEDLRQPVLLRSSQQQLGMIPVDYPHFRVHQITDTDRPSKEQRDFDLAKLMAAHPKVFDGVCRELDCEPVHPTLREGAIPVQIRGHRNIAEPLMQMFHDELMSQVEQGLIRAVQPGTITPFISGVVTLRKLQSISRSSTNGS